MSHAHHPAAGRALSLHIGVNTVDPIHYAGWSGPLAACEFDARDMATVATSRQFDPTLLLTAEATRGAVIRQLRAAAAALRAGDRFFLTFSGHGGQVDDTSGDDDETDRLDETWCLHDGQLIDDELYYELSRFAAGVRILVLSDSCHSGTAVRAGPPSAASLAGEPRRVRQMPSATARAVYEAHRPFYDSLQRAVKAAVDEEVDAGARDPDAALAQVPTPTRIAPLVRRFRPSVVLISGCQDNQFSMDGAHNGAFTERLLTVWDGGRFHGSLERFHAHIVAGMPPTQSPNLFTLGPAQAMLEQAPLAP